MARNPWMHVRMTPKPPVLKTRMGRLALKMGDLRVPHRQISVWLYRWVNQNFRGEGILVGGWRPFKIGGRRRKMRGKWTIDRSARLLQDTGRLRASFATEYSMKNVVIGSDLDYSQVHEYGMGHVPVRRMLPQHTDRSVSLGIRTIYEKWIQQVIRSA